MNLVVARHAGEVPAIGAEGHRGGALTIPPDTSAG
jgi:hypothetical protein